MNMQVNLVSCVFVLESEKNENIRKNDIKKLKILVDKDNSLPYSIFNGGELKKQVRNDISNIIGSDIFHLEQVFSMNYDNAIDIIYLAVTNKEHILRLDDNFKLIDFGIKNNSEIMFDKDVFEYKTKEIIENNNVEYVHEINVDDMVLQRELMNLLISYKKIRGNIDSTDIIFKFMGDTFTLEDVRNVYELIKECNVDKSNFRKRIIKYCEKVDAVSAVKNGFRPSQRYKFKPLEGDVWL